MHAQRGPEGGYWLARPAEEISLAEVIRVIDGPLAHVRGQRPEHLGYHGCGPRAAGRLDRAARQRAADPGTGHGRRRGRRARCPSGSPSWRPTRAPGADPPGGASRRRVARRLSDRSGDLTRGAPRAALSTKSIGDAEKSGGARAQATGPRTGRARRAAGRRCARHGVRADLLDAAAPGRRRAGRRVRLGAPGRDRHHARRRGGALAVRQRRLAGGRPASPCPARSAPSPAPPSSARISTETAAPWMAAILFTLGAYLLVRFSRPLRATRPPAGYAGASSARSGWSPASSTPPAAGAGGRSPRRPCWSAGGWSPAR